MVSGPSFVEMAPRYTAAWGNLHIDAGYDRQMDEAARLVLAGMPRYRRVGKATNVPPVLIGLSHKMESDCNFNTHLHNGDPLRARTYHVPAGRPPVWPPDAPYDQWWEISAEDALRYQGFDKVSSWSLERIAYCLEKYNGWGYYYHGVPSAYLYSFSNQYHGGKYVADGVWSASAWSSQIGALTLLKWMLAMDPSLEIVPSDAPVPVQPAKASVPTVTPVVEAPPPASPAPAVETPAPETDDSIFDPNYLTNKVIKKISGE